MESTYSIIRKEAKTDDAIKYNYLILDKNGIIISKANIYDFKIKDFDWLLMCDLRTIKSQQRKGYASRLIEKIFNDFSENFEKGIYIFVKKNNKRAICLYYKMGFKKLKLYMLKNSN